MYKDWDIYGSEGKSSCIIVDIIGMQVVSYMSMLFDNKIFSYSYFITIHVRCQNTFTIYIFHLLMNITLFVDSN